MIHIIGIGYRDIDNTAVEIINASEHIVTSQRLYERFRTYEIFPYCEDKILVINSVLETINYLKENKNKLTVLLASGDPLFHGIGRIVINEIGKEFIKLHPDLSSIQVAFSRIKETWDDAFLMSLHGNFLATKHKSFVIEDLPHILANHYKVAILTDSINNPHAIADVLLKANLSDVTMYVCQRLGYDDEEVLCEDITEISNYSFKEPNVVIVLNKNKSPNDNNISTFSITEDEIAHKEGLITKDEVRAIILHKLELPFEGVFWDIGAGSGAVSIDIAIKYPKIRVYAIEKNNEQWEFIENNIKKFKTKNITLIKKSAPQGLSNLPSPDRVFIGGSDGYLRDILALVIKKSSKTLKIVLTATMIETMNEAIRHLNQLDFKTECTQISLSRLTPISKGNYFKALNPVFIIRAY
ncbi:MAG: precorrin-6y C5,15-methyltransferase (decarboxylating) subunit CbiE [Thermodesulfovibrionales bacterium]|nr:precorrin-6y C5,15-methyltransferase (decarboxylating) subunit CbiE [Thermodesulfovibrionales bacterium]